MHELSLVRSVVDLVDEQVKSHHASGVSAITLEIGQLAGVEYDAFCFAWETGIRDSVMQDAELIIERPSAIGLCDECGQTQTLDELYTPCSNCGAIVRNLISGDELKIKQIILNE